MFSQHVPRLLLVKCRLFGYASQLQDLLVITTSYNPVHLFTGPQLDWLLHPWILPMFDASSWISGVYLSYTWGICHIPWYTHHWGYTKWKIHSQTYHISPIFLVNICDSLGNHDIPMTSETPIWWWPEFELPYFQTNPCTICSWTVQKMVNLDRTAITS